MSMKHYSAFLIVLSVWGLTARAQNRTYDDVLQDYRKNKSFSGVVLIAENGRIRFLNAAGAADRNKERPLTAATRFRIASLTKTFTAVLAMQLVEEGKLKLEDPISFYLPDYAGPGGRTIRIVDLLTYSSGLPNCESYEGTAIYKTPTPADSFIRRYCSGPLTTEPGRTFSYNNGDYVILGKIVEQITGKPFETVLRQRITAPLGMKHTGMTNSDHLPRNLAHAYLYDDSLKTFFPDSVYRIENFFAAGAMHSTAEDLLKFDRALFGHRLLKEETVNTMIRPIKSLGNVGMGFWYANGYGLLNTPFVYRPGGIYGSSANWIHVLGADRAIIVLSNTNATNLFEMSQQLNGVAVKQEQAGNASD